MQSPFLYLWLLCGHTTHFLWVQLHWIVAQFGLCCCLKVVTSNRQVTVSFYPPDRKKEEIDSKDYKDFPLKNPKCLQQPKCSNLRQSMWIDWLDLYSPWLSFWKPISLCIVSPCSDARVSTKGLNIENNEPRVKTTWFTNTVVLNIHLVKQNISPIKEVSIVRNKDVGFCFMDVIKPPFKKCSLQINIMLCYCTETHKHFCALWALHRHDAYPSPSHHYYKYGPEYNSWP